MSVCGYYETDLPIENVSTRMQHFGNAVVVVLPRPACEEEENEAAHDSRERCAVEFEVRNDTRT